MNKKNRIVYYAAYTLLFSLLTGVILFFYYSQGRTMIDAGGDGFRQHYRALVYYSDCLREMIGSFLHGNFVIPQWDFSLGEGSDILSTMHYYVAGDLFTSLCFLVPSDKMYFYYDGVTVLRMFFSGLTFSWLCFYKKKENYPIILAAALTYVFCPFCLSNMYEHVFFISAAVYLPIIILGVEKILNDDKPYLLSISVMLSSISNVLFFYMNVLSTIIYTLVRLCFLQEDNGKKMHHFFQIAFYSIIGLLMGAIVFLPVAYQIFSGSRLGGQILYEQVYPISDYIGLYTSLSFEGYFFYGGFGILGIIAITRLFAVHKNRLLMILFGLSVIFACFPFFGAIYNALLYPTVRWQYAASLLAAYIIVDQFEEFEFSGKRSVVIFAIVTLYYVTCVILDRSRWQIHVMMLAVFAVLMLVLRCLKNRKLIGLICLGTALFSLGFTILYLFSPLYWNKVNSGIEVQKLNEMKNDLHYAFDELDDDSFYRYTSDLMDVNQSIHGEHSSTQYYWSVANGNIVEFRKQLGLSDNNNHHYSFYDDRFALNALADVKYFVKDQSIVPYGYTYLDALRGYSVYISDYKLSPVYVYDTYTSMELWNELDLSGKNDTILQNALLDHDLEGFAKGQYKFQHEDLEMKIECSDGIELKDGKIVVTEADATLRISSNEQRSGEYYIVIEGLYSDTNSNILVSYGGQDKILFYKGPYHFGYPDKHDFMMCLGYYDGMKEAATIRFLNPGVFNYKELKLVYQPIEGQVKNLDDMLDVDVRRFDTKTNAVETEITLDGDKIVCFSIPYSKGWKAYIDGEAVELYRCNIQYMAVAAHKGEHLIELRYETPLLKVGTGLSLAGSAVLLFLWLKNKRYNRIS